MNQHKGRKQEAEAAAGEIRRRLAGHPAGEHDAIPVGMVFGTGWGDALALHYAVQIPFGEIPGFEALGTLDGHRRVLEIGFLDEACDTPPVAVLRGRVHMNEDPVDPAVPRMVRLQVAMLCELGARRLVLTCAAGSLTSRFRVGDLAYLQSFVMFGNEVMPLWAGEFVSPEDALARDLSGHAATVAERVGLTLHEDSAHAYVRGPHFEGRAHDKGNLKRLGATTVGMSVKPECCVAALYGAQALGIAFITNDDVEAHEHETNVTRAKAAGDKLGAFLSGLVSILP